MYSLFRRRMDERCGCGSNGGATAAKTPLFHAPARRHNTTQRAKQHSPQALMRGTHKMLLHRHETNEMINETAADGVDVRHASLTLQSRPHTAGTDTPRCFALGGQIKRSDQTTSADRSLESHQLLNHCTSTSISSTLDIVSSLSLSLHGTIHTVSARPQRSVGTG